MTVGDCLSALGVDLTAEAVIEDAVRGYLAVTVHDEAYWLVLVPEGSMHGVERVLGTR